MTTLGYDATPLLGQRSGVGHYTERLLAAMIALNPQWQFRLYSNRPLGPLDDGLQAAIAATDYFPRSRWLWMQLALPRAIQRNRPDLVHYTNSLAPLRMPGPYVLTLHDASLYLYRHYHPWKRLIAMRPLLPVVAQRAAAVITPSQTARDDLVRTLRLPMEKIHVVPEAAPAWFKKVEDRSQLAALRDKYKLPDEFVLFVGTLEPRKNLERLVRAVGEVHRRGRPVTLVLSGASGWGAGNGRSLGAVVQELALERHVRFLGYVPTADLPGLYSLATVFAFPSLYEGFGLPVVEAMACGAAVLTSGNTAMAEISQGAAHWIDPTSVEDIAAGLWQLLSDAELRACLGRRAQRQARQYSWERAAAETAAVYQTVLNR